MPRIIVFDSGLGGLSVLREIRAARPDAAITYVADTDRFPYGDLAGTEVIARAIAIFRRIAAENPPDLAVIACNTASTLVLPPLRAEFAFPFVGTVPAIKPAAARTTSGLVSVLATPGTVKRDYTRALIDTYAFHVDVTLVGAARLARLAEAALRGEPVPDDAIVEEIAPAFVKQGAKRTDTVVLACTHYPLLLDRLERLAPWPVDWIDPAPAIARRAASLLGGVAERTPAGPGAALFTALPDDAARLGRLLARFGLSAPEKLTIDIPAA
jgi:glutamate racemase